MTPKVYSGTDTGDLRRAATVVQARYPDASLLMCGYSLGAVLIGKLLAQLAQSPPLPGVCSLAPCLHTCA